MAEYIEREATITKIREEGVYGSGYSNQEREDNVVDMIESIPAANVQPVVRAKWDDKPVAFFLKCTNCGCCVGHRYDVFLDRGELNFCPNCGADMREA